MDTDEYGFKRKRMPDMGLPIRVHLCSSVVVISVNNNAPDNSSEAFASLPVFRADAKSRLSW
jgi:hypothetical protein